MVFHGTSSAASVAQAAVVDVGDDHSMKELTAAMNAGEHPYGAIVRAMGNFDAWASFQQLHKFVQAAGGLVADEKGRLLAIRRLGTWDLPKGKVEKGEAIDRAAVREVQEECGLQQVSLVGPVISTWHTYERNGKQHLKRTDWFHMKASANEHLVAQTEEDIEEVRWMDASGVLDMEQDTYPSLLPVLEAWKKLH